MVSDDTVLCYPDWTTPFTVHTNAFDKQLGDFISQNDKPIVFFSIRLSNPQRNYATTKKELLGRSVFTLWIAQSY